MPEPDQLFLQRLKILDDAVMHDRDPVGGDWVRVLLVRLAVRRPARMADADRARHRLAFEAGEKVLHLAFNGRLRIPAALEGSYPGPNPAAEFPPFMTPSHRQ